MRFTGRDESAINQIPRIHLLSIAGGNVRSAPSPQINTWNESYMDFRAIPFAIRSSYFNVYNQDGGWSRGGRHEAWSLKVVDEVWKRIALIAFSAIVVLTGWSAFDYVTTPMNRKDGRTNFRQPILRRISQSYEAHRSWSSWLEPRLDGYVLGTSSRPPVRRLEHPGMGPSFA